MWRERCVGGLLITLLFIALVRYGPVGADWYYTFRPVARGFIAGHTHLYDDPAYGYFNAPWLMVVLVPLALLPVRVGQAALTLLSLALVLVSLRTFTRSMAVTALAVSTPFTVDLVLRGQVDAFALAGVVLTMRALEQRRAWWLAGGLWLMSIKPLNVVLVFLLALFALRGWMWSERARALSLLGMSAAVSLAVCGLDWPMRYVRFSAANPVYRGFSVSLWDMPELWLAVSAIAFVWWWSKQAWHCAE